MLFALQPVAEQPHGGGDDAGTYYTTSSSTVRYGQTYSPGIVVERENEEAGAFLRKPDASNDGALQRDEAWTNSGTLTIETAGDSGATVLRQIPDSDGVQQLLNHMVEEDADRRAQESASYIRGTEGRVDDDEDGPQRTRVL